MNMNKLKDELMLEVTGKLEETLAHNEGITVEQARDRLKNASFSEWLAISEANVDKNPSLTSGTVGSSSAPATPATPATPRTPTNAQTANAEPGTDTNANANANAPTNTSSANLKTGDQVSIVNDKDEEELVRVLNTFGTDVEVETETGERKRVPVDKTKSAEGPGLWSQMKSGFKTGRGLVNKESAEIEDLKRLSGIQETSTAGATGAGSIAAGPSVIGNTNDGHKPTVQLRKKERIKRDQRKYDSEKAKRDASKTSSE